MYNDEVLMMYQSKLTIFFTIIIMVMKLDCPPAYGMNFKKTCVFFSPIAIADNHENLKCQDFCFISVERVDYGKVSSLYCFITLKVTENAFRLHIITSYVASYQ